MVDKNNKKKKLNKNNRRAITVIICFFIIISASYAAYECSDIHETIRDAGVSASSPVNTDTAEAVSTEDTNKETPTTEEPSTDTTTEVTTEVTATSEAVSTTEATTADNTTSEQPTSEASTDASTTEATTGSEASTGATTEDVRNNPIFSENNTILPDIVDVPCSDWYDSRYYEPNKLQSADYFDKTVFIGDSRTESLAFYSGFDNVNAFAYKGLNVGALETERCININGVKYTVYEAVSMTKYDNYYISFGINELGWVYLDVFTEDISKLVDLIYKVNPRANVYIASVVPVSKAVSDTDDVFNMENVEKFNKAIIKLCHDREDVIYIDYAAAVRDADGYLPEEGTVDGKHCISDYSRRIMEYILLHTYKHR